jgi:hypothetical protein
VFDGQSSLAGSPELHRMRYFSTVLFPDASLVSEGWLDLPLESLPYVGAEGKFRGEVAARDLSLVLDGTADGGRVICSVSKDGVMVTHVAVVSGAEPDEDRTILDLFVKTLYDAPVVRELAGANMSAFDRVATIRERPLCAVVLLPLESPQDTRRILDWQNRWVASHLHAVVQYRH